MIRTTLAVLFVLAALAPAAPAHAGDCKPVTGSYTSQQQDCGPGRFCTAGQLIGGIQGGYTFQQTGALPPTALGGDAVFANAIFYVGESDVVLKDGDHVRASDSGVIDLPPPVATGKQAALLIVHGGTGAYATATGFLQLRGTLAFAADGTIAVRGDYSGQICTP
jgi:hypothetical protein